MNHHRHHNRFFPTPHYLEMSSVGMDISDRSIKYISLAQSHGALEVAIHGEKKVPVGVIESGKIKDPKTLSRLLQEIKREHNLRFVRASLPEEQMYLFQMGVPKMKADEIRGTIELSLEEHVPLLAQDVLFDYEIIEEKKDSFELLVIVSPIDVIEEYTALFEDAGLELLSLELEASAVARAVINREDAETYMIVDFGDARSGISIIRHGVPLFTSTVEIGGATLTEMIAKNFNIPFEEAEKMKIEAGLTRDERHKDLFPVLLNGMSVLLDEVNRHYIYWHTHKDQEGNDHSKIHSILICGGNANLSGLVEYFATGMRTQVTLAHVWSNITTLDEYIPPLSFKESLSYATAIGLALGDFEQKTP